MAPMRLALVVSSVTVSTAYALAGMAAPPLASSRFSEAVHGAPPTSIDVHVPDEIIEPRRAVEIARAGGACDDAADAELLTTLAWDLRDSNLLSTLEHTARTVMDRLLSDPTLCAGCSHIRLEARVKSPASLMLKMKRKNWTPSAANARLLHDIAAMRVILTPRDGADGGRCSEQPNRFSEASLCYRSLAVATAGHPAHVKDFVAQPKENGYSSVHADMMVPASSIRSRHDGSAVPIELQLRTARMHFDAEYGSASHKAYKEGQRREMAGMSRNNVLLFA